MTNGRTLEVMTRYGPCRAAGCCPLLPQLLACQALEKHLEAVSLRSRCIVSINTEHASQYHLTRCQICRKPPFLVLDVGEVGRCRQQHCSRSAVSALNRFVQCSLTIGILGPRGGSCSQKGPYHFTVAHPCSTMQSCKEVEQSGGGKGRGDGLHLHKTSAPTEGGMLAARVSAE